MRQRRKKVKESLGYEARPVIQPVASVPNLRRFESHVDPEAFLMLRAKLSERPLPRVSPVR